MREGDSSRPRLAPSEGPPAVLIDCADYDNRPLAFDAKPRLRVILSHHPNAHRIFIAPRRRSDFF